MPTDTVIMSFMVEMNIIPDETRYISALCIVALPLFIVFHERQI